MNLAQYAAATGTTPAAFRDKLLDDHGVTVSHETVRRWFNGTLEPGPKKMDLIEAATGGKVTRQHQRPDIFGPPAKRRRAA